MTKNVSINRVFITCFSALLCFFSCSNNHKVGCEIYRNGNFIFRLSPQYGGNISLINRNDSIQIETDKETGFYSKLKIYWLDECTYEVLLLETTFPFSDSIQHIRRTIPMRAEILVKEKEYYVFKAQRKNSMVMIDTMWVDDSKTDRP